MRVLLATGLEEMDKDIAGELLRLNIEVVGECYYREGVLALAKNKNADVIVISSHLPGQVEILDLIKDLRMVDIRVVFLPGRRDDRTAVEMSQKAVAHGVYDIVWDTVKIKTVVNMIINPGTYAQAGIEPDETEKKAINKSGFKKGAIRAKPPKNDKNSTNTLNTEKESLFLKPEKPLILYTNQPEKLSKKHKATPYISEADTAVIYLNAHDAEIAKETIKNPVCLVLESLSMPEIIRLALKGVAVVNGNLGVETFLELIQSGQKERSMHFNKDINIISSASIETNQSSNAERIPNLYVTYSPSTGVGKTFIAVNAAMWLASKGIKTALVDLDIDKADLWHTTYMDILVVSPKTTVSSWSDSNGGLAQHPDLPMFVLPGTMVTDKMPKAEDIKNILKTLARQHDVVIADLNAMIRLSYIAVALNLAERVFLLSDLSEKCVIQTSMILSQALNVINKDRMCLVVNKIRPKQMYLPKDISNMFGFPNLSEVPEDVKLVNWCLKKKKYPVLTKSAVGESLRKCFGEELKRFSPIYESKRSIFSLFRKGETSNVD
jgi:MinD-like ATPase involved in chromosome partitioning or flagellar assembly/DNA-binding NarL/FixJ family response regulator